MNTAFHRQVLRNRTFLTRAFRRAVAEAVEERASRGLPSYGIVDGELVEVAPDGTSRPVTMRPSEGLPSLSLSGHTRRKCTQ